MNRVIAAAVVLFAVPALAQVEKVIQEEDRVIYKKVTNIDVSDHLMEVERTLPSGSMILVPTRPGFANMMTVRANFTPELEKSVDNL